MKNTYPVRLSTDELRQELDAYLDARRRAGKAPATLDLDSQKAKAVEGRWDVVSVDPAAALSRCT